MSTLAELAIDLHDAQAITAAPASGNAGINSDLRGMYVTARRGLATRTYFVGVRLSTGEEVVVHARGRLGHGRID